MPSDDAPDPIAVFAYTGLIIAFVFVWMAEQGYFVYRYTNATKVAGDKAAKPVLVLWVLSVIFMFTGPCLPLLSFGALVGGVVHLRKHRDHAPTRTAALAIVVTSASTLVVTALSVPILAWGGYLG